MPAKSMPAKSKQAKSKPAKSKPAKSIPAKSKPAISKSKWLRGFGKAKACVRFKSPNELRRSERIKLIQVHLMTKRIEELEAVHTASK